LDSEGRVKALPAKYTVRQEILAYLAGKFEKDRIYTEKEVNAIIDNWHSFGDFFLLRRSLIDSRLMTRTPSGSQYWIENRDVPGRG
jgi:hypothetical protein